MKSLISNKTPLALAVVAAMGISTVLGTKSVEAAWVQDSSVTDTVTDNGNGTWTYDFTLTNTSYDDGIGELGLDPWVVDWELPYFTDMGITNITSPWNWSYAIETIGVANAETGWDGVAAWQDPSDPWYAGADSPYTTGTEVFHWYCGTATEGCWEPVTPGQSMTGFSFTSIYGPTDAPYQTSWDLMPINTGDPSFPIAGVASPSATNTSTVSVPESSSLALLGAGLLAFVGVRRKRKTQ